MTDSHLEENIALTSLDEDIVERTTDPEALLLTIVDSISACLEAERTTIFLYDTAKKELCSYIGEDEASKKGIRVPLGVGIAGKVMETGEILWIPDPYNDPRFNAKVDKETGFYTKNIFCQPLVNAQGTRIGVIEVLNKKTGTFTNDERRVMNALCLEGVIALTNTRLLQRLKTAHENERQLSRELSSQNVQLQGAFRDLADKQERLELINKRLHKVRLAASIAIVLLFLSLGFYLWHIDLGRTPTNNSTDIMALNKDMSLITAPVKKGEINVTLSLLGVLEPKQKIAITSKIESVVKEKFFNEGEIVKKGDLLLTLETSKLETQLREALAEHLKVKQEYMELSNWESSIESNRARRALEAIKQEAEQVQRLYEETKKLYAEGIVSRTELEATAKEAASTARQVLSSEEDLRITLSKANKSALNMAKFQLQNTEERIKQLENLIAMANVKAPLTGTIRPLNLASAENKAITDIQVGSSVNNGSVLCVISDLSGLTVKTKVDEVQIAKIKLNQQAKITFEAFANLELPAYVSYISPEADEGEPPSFAIKLTVPSLTPEAQKLLRMGMSAQLHIVLYQNKEALTIPLAALQGTSDNPWVLVKEAGKEPNPKAFKKVKVEVGATTPEAVEVLSPLQLGDEVFLGELGVDAES